MEGIDQRKIFLYLKTSYSLKLRSFKQLAQNRIGPQSHDTQKPDRGLIRSLSTKKSERECLNFSQWKADSRRYLKIRFVSKPELQRGISALNVGKT